ncbi:MAG: hypothetical protein K1X92_08065 [Bacteroidia bacterium]|nr:hypothetical protein [Bacteroidia bacterium]
MDNQNHIQTLAEIRALMERSSRFISLSGLSGVIAGIAALAGATAMYARLGLFSEGKITWSINRILMEETDIRGLFYFFLTDAFLVLFTALAGALFFTHRRAIRQGQSLWSKLSFRLGVNLFIPLITGAVFCFLLLLHRDVWLIAPGMLIFYGLGLVNGSKYTLEDIRYLGYCQIVLGLLAMAYPQYGLLLWALGFGVLHILYGIMMWKKYGQ